MQAQLNGQPLISYDVAQTLENKSGAFLVQRAGQTAVVVTKPGHSIVSWTPVGAIEQTMISPGSSPPYTITELDAEALAQALNPQQQQQFRTQRGTSGD